MNHDVVVEDQSEAQEEERECEAIRAALAEALLRFRDGRWRVPGKTVLSSLEEMWVSDVALMLVGVGVPDVAAARVSGQGRKKLSRGLRVRLAKILMGNCEPVACVSEVEEFEYVPISSGAQGAVLQAPQDEAASGSSIAAKGSVRRQ